MKTTAYVSTLQVLCFPFMWISFTSPGIDTTKDRRLSLSHVKRGERNWQKCTRIPVLSSI